MEFLLVLFLILISLIINYLRYKYKYWQLMGVKQLKCNFLLGNISKLKSIHHTLLTKEVYDNFKDNAKVAGIYIFTKPVALILDLDVVKSVMIKDFQKFNSRRTYKNDKDVLSHNLFNLEGSLWKPLRNKFSPSFTASKMKFMFPTIKNVSEEFVRTYDKYIGTSNILNIHDLNGRFTIDVIGTCILGIQCNSLKDPQAEFRQVGLKVFGSTNFNIRWHLFKITYVNIMKFTGFKRRSTFIENFFQRVVREGVLEREKQGIVRNDFVDLLLELKKSKDRPLTYDQMAAQLFVFFVAGFETSSTTMSNILFELGRHSEIQEKVRKEIRETLEKHNNEFSYEAMMDMNYLEQIITESLRLYPPLSFLERVSNADFQVPDTNVVLPAGTEVYIPVSAIHHDPAIYENPLEFQPERFSPSEVAKRHPQAFLGFGDGPRNCIGLRFGRMQTKIGLIALLSKYRFLHSHETCNEIEFSNHSTIMNPAKGIYLGVEKLL